jgi:DNA (cytosine-5)-methyltransferase 1
MSNLKSAVFQHLNFIAVKYFPELIHDHEAIASQWLHALAYKQVPFGKAKGVTFNKLLSSLEKYQIIKAEIDLSKLLTPPIIAVTKKPQFTFIDLFAGIGGMRIGFQRADGISIFSSEFEKNAQETYFLNHGEKPFGDITKFDPFDIPSHDVLLAGFPCQPFSIAGKVQGFNDTQGRGNLFFYIAILSLIVELWKFRAFIYISFR